jgi:hypothetical protein
MSGPRPDPKIKVWLVPARSLGSHHAVLRPFDDILHRLADERFHAPARFGGIAAFDSLKDDPVGQDRIGA